MGAVLGRLRLGGLPAQLPHHRRRRLVRAADDRGPRAHDVDDAGGEGAVRAPLRAQQPAGLGADPTSGHTRGRAPRMMTPSLLTPFDLHLFNEGTHSHLYEKLGAHISTDPEGTSFAVWAPNADWVSVMGDFNGWNRDANKLVPREQSRISDGFIPGVGHGALYKYHVHSRVTRTGADKADPFAVYAEQPPRQASVVWDLGYGWGAADWLSTRP